MTDKPRLVRTSDGRKGRTEPIRQGRGSAMRSHLRHVERTIGNVNAGLVERTILGLFTPGGKDGGDLYGHTIHVAAARLVFRYGKPNPRQAAARATIGALGSFWLENVLTDSTGKPRLVGIGGSGNDAGTLAGKLTAAWSGRNGQ